MSHLTYILSGFLFTGSFFLFPGNADPHPPMLRKEEVRNDSSKDYLFNLKNLYMFTTPVDTPPPAPNPGNSPYDPPARDDDAPFLMPNPSNVVTEYELDEDGKGYYVHERVGGIDIRPPSYMTMEEYLAYRRRTGISDYFGNRSSAGEASIPEGLKPTININSEAFRDIFGGGSIEIRPNGTALLDIGYERNRMMNPSLPIRQQRTGNLKFDQQIQLNVVGKIGEKMRLNFNWDTQATFDFENQMKLQYTGNEDEILQKLEAGNVSLPLQGSLISGGSTLFGIKTALKFGPLTVTTIASQQKGRTQSVTVKGGAQQTNFEKKGNEYDENRHFFLSHFFKARYDYALSSLPALNSSINITRIEVWITNNNSSSTVNNRNAVGFIDLGESTNSPDPVHPSHKGVVFGVPNPVVAVNPGHPGMPDNDANALYSALESDPVFDDKSSVDSALTNGLNLRLGVDFEKIENMRKLNENEYYVHPQLGYVSLNSALQPNQVLYVAYQYQYLDSVYQVGDFSQDPGKQANQLNSNVLFLKMLKPSTIKPYYNSQRYPTWDLMMKNIYSIGGYGLRPDNFRLEIMYDSRTSAGTIGYLPSSPVKDKPLLQVFELDNLSNNSEALPDNFFDFIQNITILPDKGLVIFPVREPFGSHLEGLMAGNAEDIDKYVYNQLYTETRQDAIQYSQAKDRFLLKGSYQGASGSEINLNSINISPNSVKVTANGIQLQEGTDYRVDYNIGKVIILNQGLLTSGQEIKVTFETNSLFGLNSQTLVGSRFDLNLSKDIQLGATILHMNERPMTAKINIGDEPISNVIWGVDGMIRKDSRWLTRAVDKLPFLQTKEISTVTAQSEFAMLLPGHPKAIAIDGEKGIAYLDDFESAKTTLDLMGWRAWNLAAFPGDNGNNGLYVPGPGYNASLSPGFSRAKLAWYSIDPTFFYGNIPRDEYPEAQAVADLNDPYTRLVSPTEVFPNQTVITGDNLHTTFDLFYSPFERGPYNYEIDPARLNPDGTFVNPSENWGGITRKTGSGTDFEAANYEFIEFWVMDPFMKEADNPGMLYLNLGRVSEDVVKDGNRNFENGLPADPANTTVIGTTSWGNYPITNPPVNSFNNEPEARENQDVGLDGIKNTEEPTFFSAFLDTLNAIYGPTAGIVSQMTADPSSDNYSYFRGDNVDGLGIQDRYRKFNGHEGNTPIQDNSTNYSTQGSPTPDTEDLNSNGTLNQIEEYYEYKISLNKADMVIGKNYIVDIIDTKPDDLLPNGKPKNTKWYQFRVPLVAGKPINNISNFKAIEYVRMYMTGFEKPVNLRFARFQVVSTTWRTFRDYLGVEGDTTVIEPPDPSTTFEIGTVNIEENSGRDPFNYVMPPGIRRQLQVGNPQPNLLQNEQSLVMKACNLQDGDGRGVFRLFNYDLRSYKTLKMWIHAENVDGSGQDFEPGELRAFIRLGSDINNNYYEYELPLTASSPGDQTVENIWQEVNQMSVDLERLNAAKSAREVAGWPVGSRFEFSDTVTGNRIFVMGTPKLSEIKNIMIGIRNHNDAQGPICAEVWVNELRLVNFNEEPGWAANARVTMKLADWANITMSGSHRTPGFGSIEQRINNRTRETTTQYDVAGNFQMGMFFPRKWGVQLPLYVTYGERLVDPQFNPLEADVLMTNYLENFSADTVELVRTGLQDYVRNKSISLNSIRKVRVTDPGGVSSGGGSSGSGKGGDGGGPKGPKTHPWDIENFVGNLSYAEIFSHNYTTLKRLNVSQKAGLAYSYNFTNKPIEPFKNAKWKSIITAFNFNPLPKTLSASIQGDRRYEENWIRPTASQSAIDPTFFKQFLITRNYQMRWDLTRTLSVNFNAVNAGRVDEPRGLVDTDEERDSIYSNLFSFGRETDSLGRGITGKDKTINIGRNTRYNQSTSINWILPTDKFKLTNWVSGTLNYTGDLTWNVGPDNQPTLGNTLMNGQNIQAQARLTLDNLYSKIPGIKKLLQEQPGGKPAPAQQPGKPPVKPEATSEVASKDSVAEEDTFQFLKAFGKSLVKILLSVKNVNASWTKTNGTTVAGYLPQTDNFGMDFHYVDGQGNPSPAVPPSVPFIFGWQESFETSSFMLDEWASNGWISRNPNLATPFQRSQNEQITGQTQVTLFKDFKVDLNITRSKTQNYTELFRFDSINGEYDHFNRLLTGNYNMSYIFINSAFDKDDNAPKHFVEFETNARGIVSYELAKLNPFTDKGAIIPDAINTGYSGNSQDVLLPAFLGAYSVADPRKLVSRNTLTNTFPAIPLPNWSVNYTGLSKLEPFKNLFSSVTLKHTYRGSYSIGSFTNDVRWQDAEAGFSDQLIQNSDSTLDYRSRFVVQSASFTESFAPLLGLTFNFKSGLTASVDYKQDRNLSFSVGNKQLTEARRKDLLVAIGWRKDKLNTMLHLFGKDINMQNALNARLEITLRDNKTRNRMLDSEVASDYTSGTTMFIFKPSVDYVVNTKLNIRFYIEHSRTKPAISTSFPSRYTAVGFQLRFTLAN